MIDRSIKVDQNKNEIQNGSSKQNWTEIHPFIFRDLKTPIYNMYRSKNDRSIKIKPRLSFENDPKQILCADLRRSTTAGREQGVQLSESSEKCGDKKSEQ